MERIPDVVSARYLGDYRIEIVFDDGETGALDFFPFLSRGGVFERFRDMDFFRAFRVDPELGTLAWGQVIDIAPEVLYARATGSPLPDWMIEDRITG
jgi:hypothetical protein